LANGHPRAIYPRVTKFILPFALVLGACSTHEPVNESEGALRNQAAALSAQADQSVNTQINMIDAESAAAINVQQPAPPVALDAAPTKQ